MLISPIAPSTRGAACDGMIANGQVIFIHVGTSGTLMTTAVLSQNAIGCWGKCHLYLRRDQRQTEPITTRDQRPAQSDADGQRRSRTGFDDSDRIPFAAAPTGSLKWRLSRTRWTRPSIRDGPNIDAY